MPIIKCLSLSHAQDLPSIILTAAHLVVKRLALTGKFRDSIKPFDDSDWEAADVLKTVICQAEGGAGGRGSLSGIRNHFINRQQSDILICRLIYLEREINGKGEKTAQAWKRKAMCLWGQLRRTSGDDTWETEKRWRRSPFLSVF